MPAKGELTMRQLRYMLRLHHDGVSAREIGRMLGGSARHDPGQSAPRACDRNCLACTGRADQRPQ
jgi:hypothetical protein